MQSRQGRGAMFAVVASAMAIACAKPEPAPAPRLEVAPVPSAAASAPNVVAAPSGPRVVMPGTGVSLVPPPGVHLMPVGTTLTNDDGKVLVSIAIGSHSLDEDPNWLAAFPGKTESVRVGGLPATLRRRARASGSGASAFDTWVLTVNAGGLSLMLMVIDKGEDPERWKLWRPNVLSVEWKPQAIDSEKAFGLTAGEIPGMKQEKEVAGGLTYRAPPPDDKRITLFLTAFPLVLPDDPETCFEVLRRSIKEEDTVGKLNAFTKNGFRGCETETTRASGKSTYWSVVSAPENGGIVVAIADAPAATFRTWQPRFAAAVRSLRATR